MVLQVGVAAAAALAGALAGWFAARSRTVRPRELREVADALEVRESQCRMLLEQASDGIVVCDLDGRYLDANSKALEMFGYSREEFLRLSVHDIAAPEDLERQPLRLPELRAGNELLFDRLTRRRDGSRVVVEISAKRVGDVIHGIYRDVTARKAAEQELKHALSLLSATIDSTADAILVVDRDGRFIVHNRKMLEIWGLSEAMMVGGNEELAMARAREHVRDPVAFHERVEELYSQPDAEGFDLIEFKDGRIVERYSMPYRVAGETCGRVWNFRDVTGRRRAEEALRRSEEHLRQAQKMEAIGRLAGGVAHDFNNLLTAILGNTSLMLLQIPAGAPLREHAEEVERASERAAALVRQLLAFSRKQMLELQTLDLNHVVHDMHSMLQRVIGEHIKLVTHTGDQLGRVRADRSQLEQVLLNLVVNARDSMPDGGTLVLETADVELDESFPVAEDDPLPAGRYVMLSVSDTGVGMSDAIRRRVFEPFFTTKERGQGTGLGLSTVYGIVRQCEGGVYVYSRPGVGSAFKIFLPRLEARVVEPALPPVAEAEVEALTGTETVLLVEDEPMVRGFFATCLARQGYRVLEARDGDDALCLARGRSDIDLLVTDVVMPGMNGRELAERLERAMPHLEVLYVSGYTDDLVSRHGVVAQDVAFLQKPFTLDTFARKVRQVLDAAERRLRVSA